MDTLDRLTFGLVGGQPALLLTAVVETVIGLTLVTGRFLRFGLVLLGGAWEARRHVADSAGILLGALSGATAPAVTRRGRVLTSSRACSRRRVTLSAVGGSAHGSVARPAANRRCGMSP